MMPSSAKGAAACVVSLLLAVTCRGEARGGRLVAGADVSSLPAVEAAGGVFLEGGTAGDPLEMLRERGMGFVRLRLWHTPEDGRCGLDETLRTARRAKDLGLGLLLDIHYSDTWADPGKQHKPAAWTGLSGRTLEDSVYAYTRDVISSMAGRGVLPDWVQVGNEVSCGMLWDDGRVCGRFDDPGQWDRFASLLEAGIAGVRDAAGDDTVAVVIHFDDGGDNSACRSFFDRLTARGVAFDIIGVSFYPWWHGTLEDLASNIDDLASRYRRGVAVVETAYPWTLGWDDETRNIVGTSDQLHDGFPAIVGGQAEFIRDVRETVAAVRDGLGAGVFYWEPAWISAPSAGSPWENLALFGFEGELLRSAEAIGSVPRERPRTSR